MRLQFALQGVLRSEVLGRMLSFGPDAGGSGLVIPVQRGIAQGSDRFMLKIGQCQGIHIVAWKAGSGVRRCDLATVG